jgi:prepilin-type N-terminal cleavage/methylation domain-containing protein
MKSGFTLSELLVALSIVGIIAAVTVPTMVGKYQKTAQALQIKKVYSDLQQNLTKLQTENYRGGVHKSRLNNGSEGIKGFFHDYYNVDFDCEEDLNKCFAEKYSQIKGDRKDSVVPCLNCGEGRIFGYCVHLKDGASICIRRFRDGKDLTGHCKDMGNYSICQDSHHGKYVDVDFSVYVDTNGPEPPNIAGRDYFGISLNDDFSIAGSQQINVCYDCLTGPSSWWSACSCFHILQQNDFKMDY